MSGRSVNSSSVVASTVTGGSIRQHGSSGLPNAVKFAGEESKDKMYEPKHMKKVVRVLTVVAYVFTVSLAAIMLSVYYVFLWNPKDVPHRAVHLTTATPISPPGTVCSQSVGAPLQDQEHIQGLPMKASHAQPSATVPASPTRQPSTNSTFDLPLDT